MEMSPGKDTSNHSPIFQFQQVVSPKAVNRFFAYRLHRTVPSFRQTLDVVAIDTVCLQLRDMVEGSHNLNRELRVGTLLIESCAFALYGELHNNIGGLTCGNYTS